MHNENGYCTHLYPASSDYVAVCIRVLLTPFTHSRIIAVPLLVDSRVESLEGFTVRLELDYSPDGSTVLLFPNEASVIIIDVTDNDFKSQFSIMMEMEMIFSSSQLCAHCKLLQIHTYFLQQILCRNI